MAFFWPLFRKALLCGVYSLKSSYRQLLQSPLCSLAAPSGLSLGSLLPLWLVPSLPGREVWWPAQSWQVCCGAIFFPFLITDLKVPRGKFRVSFFFFYNPTLICTSPQLCPWPVWSAPWSSWHSLLGGADSGAFQNRCKNTEIMWHLDCTQVDFI